MISVKMRKYMVKPFEHKAFDVKQGILFNNG